MLKERLEKVHKELEVLYEKEKGVKTKIKEKKKERNRFWRS